MCMQVVDAYAADTSVCLLPDFLGGTVPEASLCGVGTTVAVAAPDGMADAAAHVTLFRYSMAPAQSKEQCHCRDCHSCFCPCLP